MKRIYTLGTVQYVPGSDSVLIPLQQVSPNANAPLAGCTASQDALATLTPATLADRTRWSDREVKAYATAWARQDEPGAEVYTVDEWAALQAQQQPAADPATDVVLADAATIAASLDTDTTTTGA